MRYPLLWGGERSIVLSRSRGRLSVVRMSARPPVRPFALLRERNSGDASLLFVSESVCEMENDALCVLLPPFLPPSPLSSSSTSPLVPPPPPSPPPVHHVPSFDTHISTSASKSSLSSRQGQKFPDLDTNGILLLGRRRRRLCPVSFAARPSSVCCPV